MDSTLNHSKIVERYAHFFERPEVRLRFLHGTLARQSEARRRAEAALERFPFLRRQKLLSEQLLKLWLYHLIFQELSRLLPSAPSAEAPRRRLRRLTRRAPLASRLLFGCYQFRPPLAALGVVALTASLFGVYAGVAWSARRANDLLADFYGTSKRPGAQPPAAGAAYAQSPARALPDYRPGKVWVVEQKENFERYSNGARILNDFATENRPRGYHVFRGGKPDGSELRREPVGIVYHTSENDMLPFTPDNSASIEVRSRGLLEYVRRNKSYNYVIDRFGQIYRIVRDEDAAHHAGNSVWSDARGTYVGLNDSFLGVCFESSMEDGDSEERLTEAQLVAGRLLTQVLRSRHQIDDANCVAHGLVSVNPLNMRICFHHDWARGFPFEAMGLSDKYRVAPASVAEFGFTYDEETVEKLGGALWPGVAAAEEEFARRAAEAGQETEKFRRATREAFREQMEQQRRERAAE
ncbi:MAG: N-acetylmuramoyl-L-alanine amidase [Acidobacteriota bacterium]|nr:N-acetylmuramoyl-L-alanine amidase [Acidobacteriota bacterium]